MARTIRELNHELDTKKYPTRQEMREVMWDYREASEKLLKEYQRLFNKVNKVTAPFRHKREVSETALADLANRQIDVERAVNKVRG